MGINISDIRATQSEYERQIERVLDTTGYVGAIAQTVEAAITSINSGAKSFVIYGEPQSGKTEMMICLTARLVDENYRHIIVLVNDNVDLQSQNLERFRLSGLSPAPKSLQEMKNSEPLKPKLGAIIFCKKNAKDLETLIDRLRLIGHRIVIDDEADYATPDSKINTASQSKINSLVNKLVNRENGGIYIGVTATPARLDLNNTFDNEKHNWVYFKPYPSYNGHKTFFPKQDSETIDFNLVVLPDEGDQPRYLQSALTRFVVNVAELNIKSDKKRGNNYCMLVHTSGLKDDHDVDKELVERFFEELDDEENPNFQRRYLEIETDAKKRFPHDAHEIVRYVYQNRARKAIKLINSSGARDPDNIRGATDPQTPFTVAIGGNIISRGVTFNNLLCMFFTRTTAQKIQQDTYIQRARMFGNRNEYLEYFELHIPKSLYEDWHRAFAFHSLSMASIESGKPVWLEDSRIRAAAPSSIDKQSLSIDKGEISFEKFQITEELLDFTSASASGIENFRSFLEHLPDGMISDHIVQFVLSTSTFGDDSVVVHSSRLISASENIDEENITRQRGFYGGQDFEAKLFPNAVHHFKIFYNSKNYGRVLYNYKSVDKSIRFLKVNRRNRD